ncbi:MAG: MBL fold metallo-hydrolase [Clostridia bacterium]|nr:MBL fold metallo-hydrolase [Clostridia bacterium]
MASRKTNAKRAAKAAKKYPQLFAVIAVILVIIIVVFIVLYCMKLGPFKQDNSPEGANPEVTTGSEAEITNGDFSIHFLELGNKYAGDSVLIKCGNTEVLIDAGSRQASATAIKEYVDKYCTDGKLEYVIATHADQDHISGFVGNKNGNTRTGILYQYQIGTLIKFDNVKPDKEDGALYNNFLEACDYAKAQGADVYNASQCYDMTDDGAQRQYYLDDAQTLSINILYNYYYYNVDKNDENNHSVVTLLTQETESGNKYYMFSGDLEQEGESKLVDHYSNKDNSKSEYDILPEVELYKAGHHGSKTSSTSKFLSVIKPKYVTVCCCAGSPEYTKTDANTFPTQQMINNVSRYTDKIYVTSVATGLPELNDKGEFVSQSFGGYESMNGTVVFYFADGELKLWCSNNYTLLKDTEWFKQHRTWNV